MSIRAFVGLGLPEEYKGLAARIASRWGRRLRSKLTWTRPGSWHLTLKFLGHIDESQLDGAVRALGAVAWPAFDYRGLGGGFFPGARRPRVVWVGLDPAEPFVALARAVEASLAPLGFEPEARPFVPHLTLARVKLNAVDPWDALLAELDGLDWPRARADRMTLWRSVLGPQGPAYTVLAEFPAVPESGEDEGKNGSGAGGPGSPAGNA
jgi:2'-5' RNA ligase